VRMRGKSGSGLVRLIEPKIKRFDRSFDRRPIVQTRFRMVRSNLIQNDWIDPLIDV
jgi:hypothetical protein